MAPKLLKFDIMHPKAYLEKKKREWDDLDTLSAAEYRQRLIGLRSNYSDFYTHHLNQRGWEAEEFFLLDETYLAKISKELFGTGNTYQKFKSRIAGKIRARPNRWTQKVVQTYIQRFKPDVIFARSQPMPSRFWQQFRKQSLLVARLSARLPRQWHPDDWDLIYTDLDIFKDFFKAHNIPTILNRQGFDLRILGELQDRAPRHKIVFVGGMGTQNFSRRTKLFETIAARTNFKWWGYWWEYGGWGSLDDFPNLKRSFQGPVSGLEMYQLYSDSKIILNDYVDTSPNVGFNQRMFEVMGVGGFMLTRQADNLETDFPDHIFATYTNADDCVEKINHYLEQPNARKQIGHNAQQFVRQHYNYANIITNFDRELRRHLQLKEEQPK